METTLQRSGRDVLVVEDEARVRAMLGQALMAMGFTAAFAPSAESATKALAVRPYDILIVDLNLPGSGGIEFLEAVRRKGSDVQVIILTGFGDLEAARRAIHLDVVEFLTKPCALGQLEVALDRASKRRRGQLVSEAAAVAPPLDEPPPAFTPVAVDVPGAASMEDLEQRHILATLHRLGGNRAATAAELGISLRKLYYRLGEYQKRGLIP